MNEAVIAARAGLDVVGDSVSMQYNDDCDSCTYIFNDTVAYICVL